jgi:hypothetical protein
MAIFEIQGQDGSVYEVDAPNESVAVAGFKRFNAGQKADFSDRFTGGGTAQWTAGGFNPQAEANAIEGASGTSGFSDASGSIIKGIPFGDEIMSAAGAPIRATRDALRGDGFNLGRAYNEGQALEAELQRRRDARSPVASTVGAVAGGFPVAGQAAKAGFSLLNAAKPTLGNMAGRSAAEGAIYGGLYGAGEGSGLEDRATNAGKGLLTGGAVGGILGSMGRIGAGKVDRSVLPTADDLKTAAQAAYQRADDAGVVYSKDAVKRLADDLQQQFYDFGYHPELQGGAKVALSEINRLADQNVTLKGLDTARKIAGNAFQPGNKANNALTAKVAEAIDNLVANPQAGDVLTGNAPEAAAAISEARGLFKQSAKLDTVNNLLERAGLRAAKSGSGGNIENTTRQELSKILMSDRMRRGFSEEELKAVKDAVIGTKGQNALRMMGKLSPEGNGLSMLLHLLSAPLSGGATLPLAGAGMLAKRGADAMAAHRAKIAEAIIANGGKSLPEATLAPLRKAVIDALTRGSAQQLPGYIGQ